MANLKDTIGQQFGLLTVISVDESRTDRTYLVCKCECGTTKSVRATHLKQKRIVSCGCFGKTVSIKHHRSGTKEYVAWRAAKSRCLNPRDPGYLNYGGRGISMSEPWINSFEQFFSDMGACPTGMTLERINNDGPYSSDNCRWATYLDQFQNQRKTIRITHDGLTLSLRAWARRLGMAYSTLRNRYDSGLPLFDPVDASHSRRMARK